MRRFDVSPHPFYIYIYMGLPRLTLAYMSSVSKDADRERLTVVGGVGVGLRAL